MRFEKFPTLLHEGFTLVWDSRQEAAEREELVLFPETSAERAAELRARPGVKKVFRGENPRRYLAERAAEHFGRPSEKLKVLAVTGTNGKTTCVEILRWALQHLEQNVCEIGTLGVQNYWRGGRSEKFESGFTTPEAPQLQSLFDQAVAAGLEWVVMESSSHAIALERVAGVSFDGALFTNLTQDHLDFHGDMAQYEAAKARLFTELLPASSKKTRAVLNGADPAGARIAALIPPGVEVKLFAREQTFKIVRAHADGMVIEFGDGTRFHTPLIGEHNAENLVGCLELLRPYFSWPLLLQALSTFPGARGRLERVVGPKGEASRVFVDYAHTPDALRKSLLTLRALKSAKQKLWVLFGCGGDRDRGKRPLMGKEAASLADEVMLTSDNPRTEDPKLILSEIATGAVGAARVRQEVDRGRAITQVLREASPEDLVLIAGKGHEECQIVGGERREFSDFNVCQKALWP